MLVVLASLLAAHTVAAVTFPPPTGPYNVGYTQHVFWKNTLNDPVAPENALSFLLATIYYPTRTIPVPGKNTVAYLDPTTAEIWGSNWQFPNNSLQSLMTWNVYNASPLDIATNGALQKPTIIFSPGAGENAIMYNTLSSELASQGYNVVALDHPGETPYLQLPNGGQGIYGINITANWNETFAEAVYKMRISDIVATARELLPKYVNTTGAPFNTTHYFAIGHSLGGAAAASALALEPSILGGINFDGTFFNIPNVKKPFLMLGQAAHTPDVPEPTWPWFAGNQTGWFRWINIAGSGHQNFADLDDWVDLQGLRNKTTPMSVGKIWAPRMDYIVSTFVKTFFSFVLGEKEWVDVPDVALPEADYIDGSFRTP